MSKFMKLILIFIRIIKKIKVDKSWHEYIKFRTDVHFSEYNLVVEVGEIEILTEILFVVRNDKH